MFIGFDIGNTHIRCGFFTDTDYPDEIYSADTACVTNEDDLVRCIESWLCAYREKKQLSVPIDGAVYSSVVPRLNEPVDSVLRQRYNITAVSVSSDAPHGFEIHYKNPAMLGADRITNAAAVFESFEGKDCIVVDIGTAITFCVLLKERIFDGGIIAPGFGISADALERHTSQLFRTAVAPLPSIVGRSTEEGIQSGIFFGGAAMINGLIRGIEKEYGHGFTVILTGGGAGMVKPFIDKETFYEPQLTMKGLALIYRRSNK